MKDFRNKEQDDQDKGMETYYAKLKEFNDLDGDIALCFLKDRTKLFEDRLVIKQLDEALDLEGEKVLDIIVSKETPVIVCDCCHCIPCDCHQ